jgi:hypothetical protein
MQILSSCRNMGGGMVLMLMVLSFLTVNASKDKTLEKDNEKIGWSYSTVSTAADTYAENDHYDSDMKDVESNDEESDELYFEKKNPTSGRYHNGRSLRMYRQLLTLLNTTSQSFHYLFLVFC